MSKPTVLLIDFSALFRAAWHANAAGPVSVAFDATIGGVNRAESTVDALPGTNGVLVAVCCDGRNNWRKELSKEYKAQRESQPASMYGEMDRTRERLRRDGRLVWQADGFEADDVIATATMCAKTRGHEVVIASHDKDMLQLLGPSVSYIKTSDSKWPILSHGDIYDKYGVECSQFRDWLALVGDRVDGLKGCPGVGAKTAAEMLKSYGSIDGIYKAIEEEKFKPTPAIGKSLEQFKLVKDLEIKLVSLRTDIPIKFDDIYKERRQLPVTDDTMTESEVDEVNPPFVPEFEGGMDFGGSIGLVETFPSEGVAATTTSVQQKEESPAAAVVSAGSKEQPQVETKGSVTAKAEHGKPDTGVDVKEEASLPAAKDIEIVKYTENKTVAVREFNLQLEPNSFQETMLLARAMESARLYSKYKNPWAIAAAIMRGREMGYGAATSLDIFHPIEDKGQITLALHAHLIIDRCIRDRDCEYFAYVDGNDTFAEYETKHRRNPKVQKLRFTIEQAKSRGLVKTTASGKPNGWMLRPDEFLRKTCGVQLGRVVYPGAALGLYCLEEMGIDE